MRLQDRATNPRIAEVTRMLRQTITGKRLAHAFECSKGYISQIEPNGVNEGRGEVAHVVEAVREIEFCREMGVISPGQADQALEALLSLIGDAAGYRFHKPFAKKNIPGGFVEAVSRLTRKVSKLMESLQEAVDTDGPGGETITAEEAQPVLAAWRSLGALCAAGEVWVEEHIEEKS